MTSCNVLISSAGRRVVLSRLFRRALEQLRLDGRLLVTDMSPASAAFHDADRAFVVPPCADESFIPCLLEICEREGVRVLVPTIDPELPLLADAVEAFAAIGTTVCISAPATVRIAEDKHRTHAWLMEHGFPTVAQAALADVLNGQRRLTPPYIAKPARGSSSVGVLEAPSHADLAAAEGEDVVVQTVAPGVEYTVDVLVDRAGRCVSAVPRRRLEVRAGEVSKGVTERNRAVLDLTRGIVAALPGAYGVLNIQVFYEAASGSCRVIEVNARYGGGYPLAWEAGARFPLWTLEEILGLPSTVHDDWREDLVMLRYDDAVFVERADAGL